jgi:hypothetical protein
MSLSKSVKIKTRSRKGQYPLSRTVRCFTEWLQTVKVTKGLTKFLQQEILRTPLLLKVTVSVAHTLEINKLTPYILHLIKSSLEMPALSFKMALKVAIQPVE